MEAIIKTLGSSDRLKKLILARNEDIGTSDFFLSTNKSEFSPIFPHVQELDLSECGFNDTSCARLVTCLQPLASDRNLKLRLSRNPFGPRGFVSVSSLLHGSSIVELHLSKCNIGDEGIETLVDRATLDRHLGLQILDLSHNNITSKGVLLLASRLQEAMAYLPALGDLNLAGNTLNEESVQSLAGTLGKLKSEGKSALHSLDMTDTSCGIGGAVDMIRLGQLTLLRLFNNKLGSEGFLELAKVLRGGHATLENLDLGGNNAQEAGVVALLHALSIKDDTIDSKLKLVVIGGNEGGQAVEQMVKEVLRTWPGLDIARDKPRKPEGGPEGGPEGLLQS
jgi:hypothetical protein